MELIRKAAKEHGLLKFWGNGQKKGAPVSFFLPKNKMKEKEGEWKQRVLFSYYNHPLRRHGRRIGCYLTLLLKEAKTYIPSTEILSTQCTMRFIRRRTKWLKEVKSTDPLELWELDVKEMFSHLHRDEVFQSLQDFALRVQKERKKRAKEPFFAINKIDRKLDCMGTGYGEYFYNITMSEVLAFCKFDAQGCVGRRGAWLLGVRGQPN